VAVDVRASPETPATPSVVVATDPSEAAAYIASMVATATLRMRPRFTV
jgi:hypothetical protein